MFVRTSIAKEGSGEARYHDSTPPPIPHAAPNRNSEVTIDIAPVASRCQMEAGAGLTTRVRRLLACLGLASLG